MGNCGFTSIFDQVAGPVIDNPEIPVKQQVRIITALYRAGRNDDWDCEGDSEFYTHPVFITAEYAVDGSVHRWSQEVGGNIDASDQVLTDLLPEPERGRYDYLDDDTDGLVIPDDDEEGE